MTVYLIHVYFVQNNMVLCQVQLQICRQCRLFAIFRYNFYGLFYRSVVFRVYSTNGLSCDPIWSKMYKMWCKHYWVIKFSPNTPLSCKLYFILISYIRGARKFSLWFKSNFKKTILLWVLGSDLCVRYSISGPGEQITIHCFIDLLADEMSTIDDWIAMVTRLTKPVLTREIICNINAPISRYESLSRLCFPSKPSCAILGPVSETSGAITVERSSENLIPRNHGLGFLIAFTLGRLLYSDTQFLRYKFHSSIFHSIAARVALWSWLFWTSLL